MIRKRIMERKHCGHQKGLFVADLNENNQIRFGYSLCCKEDTFDKNLAVQIAKGRLKQNDPLMTIPSSIWPEFLEFYDRAARYFKGSELPPIEEESKEIIIDK